MISNKRGRSAAAIALASLSSALVASGVQVPRATAEVPQPGPPNMVFVLVDDLGWSDAGSRAVNRRTAHPFHQTPALNALAREGTTFTQAYATPTCSPTRMALLSGLNAVRPDNNVFAVKHMSGGYRDTLLTPPSQGRGDGRDVLPGSITTLGEALQGAGYHTGHIGKFHVARHTADITRLHGFDRNYGGTAVRRHTQFRARGGEFGPNIDPSLDVYAGNYTQQYVDDHVAPYSRGVERAELDALVGTPKHLTDAVGDAVEGFIGASGDRPFFAHVAHWAVHAPIAPHETRPDLYRKYRADRRVPTPSAASYAGSLEGVDQTLNRLRAHLTTTPDPRNPGRPLADNTIVVVTSDNGGMPKFGGSTAPLRGVKGELDEGGIRVPWVAWSGNRQLVGAGEVNTSVIDSTDLYPTLADYASARVPSSVRDGRSLRPALSRGATLSGARFQHFPGYARTYGRAQHPETVMHQGRYKLRYDYERQRFRLYDLRADIGERRDLAARWRTRVERMGLAMLRWAAETRAPLARLSRARPPMRFRVVGQLYDGTRVRRHPRGRWVTVRPGAPVPLVVTSD